MASWAADHEIMLYRARVDLSFNWKGVKEDFGLPGVFCCQGRSMMTPPHLLYLLEVGIITVSVSIYTCTHLQIMISISVKVNHCTFMTSIENFFFVH